MKKIYLFFSLLFLCLSCSKNTYEPEDIFELLRKGDADLEAVVSKDIGVSLVDCSTYKPKCRNVFIVKVKELEVIFLQYDTPEEAFKSAHYIGGFVVRNWAIDEVSGEPVLEAFMMKYLGARKAR